MPAQRLHQAPTHLVVQDTTNFDADYAVAKPPKDKYFQMLGGAAQECSRSASCEHPCTWDRCELCTTSASLQAQAGPMLLVMMLQCREVLSLLHSQAAQCR